MSSTPPLNSASQDLFDNAEQAETFLKLLANKNRLMILCSLIDNESNVNQLNKNIPIAQSALSQHLASLRNAGFVSTRREAQTIYYCISDQRVKRLLERLHQIFCNERKPNLN